MKSSVSPPIIRPYDTLRAILFAACVFLTVAFLQSVEAGSLEDEFVTLCEVKPGYDTVLRKYYPDIAQGIYSNQNIRSRQIERSRRLNHPIFRFALPAGAKAHGVRDAIFKIFVTSPGVDSFPVTIYGVKDGTAGDSTEALSDMTWSSAPWNVDTDRAADNLVALGTVEYAARHEGKFELRDTPELVEFLNGDSNGFVTLMLKPYAEEGKEVGFYYLSSWEAIFEDRFKPTLELTFNNLEFKPGDAFTVPLVARNDLETGNKVTQLSFLPGASQIFYYHYNPVASEGNWIIYRHVEGEQLDTSKRVLGGHQYFKVNLLTGETVTLTEKGFVSSGDLKGNLFYYIRQDGDLFRLSRLNINDLKREDLFVWAPPGYPQIPSEVTFKDPYANLHFKAPGKPEVILPLFDGNLSVNADGSQLILNMRMVDPQHDVKSIDSVQTKTLLMSFNTQTKETKQLFSEAIRVSHLQCSPADPDIYHFMENNPALIPDLQSKTRHLLFGSISTGAWGPLATGDNFVDSFKNFAHPWWGAEGRFWSDTMKQTQGDTGGFVGAGVIAFKLSPPPEGPYPSIWEVDGYEWFDGNNREWQHHYNRTDLANWHIGEGADPRGHRAGRRGRPFIQLFHAPPGADRPTYHKIARQHWTRYIGIAGYSGANPHFVPESNSIVYQDWLDLEDVSMRTMNVFVVSLPVELVNEMADDRE